MPVSERNKLTEKQAAKLSAPGIYSDGGGLYLRVRKTGGRSWLLIDTKAGKRKELALGNADLISLAEARALRDGPTTTAKKGAPTFKAFSTALIDGLESGWKNEKHRQQWRNSLATHAKRLDNVEVDKITTDDVLRVLRPIWTKIPETADRVRGRIERILNAAKAKGHISGPWQNPAIWRGHLDALLPKKKKLARGHHAAMPYSDVPAFVASLRKRPATSARALEFLILCASRTGEVIGARWDEIRGDVWEIPGERMKAGVDHTVTLTGRALEILDEMRGADEVFVFPSLHETSLSNMAMETLLRRMDMDHVTVHGFRSSFKEFAANETEFADEISEECLAHTVGSKVRRAYRRGEALERRRKLMEAWAAYIESSS